MSEPRPVYWRPDPESHESIVRLLRNAATMVDEGEIIVAARLASDAATRLLHEARSNLNE